MMEENKIKGGVYLVIDPILALPALLEKLRHALEGGVQIVQIFDRWDTETNQKDVVGQITAICHSYHVPVVINNQWELLKSTHLDGVHFDEVPDDYETIQKHLSNDHIVGITCGNDLQTVEWADQNNLDYISFCSMFPSSSVDTCEIVSFETVKKARAITDIPIFLSGGINRENVSSLDKLDFNGIAVISGIMKASDPQQSTKAYMHELQKIGKV